MTNIINDTQMNGVLNNIVRDVAKAVADKLLETNRQEIEDVVYSYRPQWYKRSNENQSFKEAWKTEVKTATNTHTAELNYEPSTMAMYDPSADYSDSDFWRHGNKYSGDVREALAEILYEGISGGLFGDGAFSDPRNAYDALIKKCNKSLDKWIKDELRKHGLTTTPTHLKISGTWK